MKTKIENGNLIITVPVDERESSTGKTILIASETSRGEAYKGKDNMTVAVNATVKNPAYVKPTAAEKVAATKAQINELQSTLA